MQTEQEHAINRIGGGTMKQREELLERLFTMQQGLEFIYQKSIQLTDLENARRKAVLIQEELVDSFGDGTKPVSERLLRWSFYAVLMGAFGNLAKFLFLGIWGEGNFNELFWYIGASLALIFLLQKKMRQHKESWIGIGIFVLLFVVLTTPINMVGITLRAIFSFDIITSVVYGALTAVVLSISFWLGNCLLPQWEKIINSLIDKENRERIEKNGMRKAEYERQIQRNYEIKLEKEQCELEISQAVQYLYAYGNGWYPRDYYYMDAVDSFINYLENMRAESIKELVNLYEDTIHKNEMLACQEEMLRLQREQFINNQKMVELLRYNNAIQAVQVAQLEEIRINTAEAAHYLQNLRVQHVHNHYY